MRVDHPHGLAPDQNNAQEKELSSLSNKN